MQRALAGQARLDLFEELTQPGSLLAALLCQQLGCSAEQLQAALSGSRASGCLEVRLDFLSTLTGAAAPVCYHTDARLDTGALDQLGERLERPTLSPSNQQRFQSSIKAQGASSMSGPTLRISSRLGSRCFAALMQPADDAPAAAEPGLSEAPWCMLQWRPCEEMLSRMLHEAETVKV